ncbi:MAG: mechanosensitive ion channel family protein [Crocinitomicaceae bacterium]|jgi:MscS family membrane protein|tara:strand:+ start:2866 stop:3927 length:1062 start_codon:yes stop_codon:yes gene_type:complete
MGFLDHIILDNSIKDWSISLGIILAAFIATKVVYWFISNIIKRLTSKTKTNLDDVLIEKLEKPIQYSILILGYWIAIHYLNIANDSLIAFLEGVASLATVLTLTSIASKVFDALVTEIVLPYVEKSEGGGDNYMLPILSKTVKAVIWTFGVVIGLDNIGFDITAMIAGLGIGGLALALAAQDSVKNIFAGVMIFLDKPFKIKDRIQIQEFDGVVEEVGLRSTRIRTLDGRIVTIPNSTFTDNSVVNVTSQPALKIVLNLGLTYDTDEVGMQKAVDVLRQIVVDNAAILEADCSAGFKDFGDFSLGILFIYYVKPEAHWLDSQNDISKEVLKRFAEAKLDFAFPTQTLLNKAID